MPSPFDHRRGNWPPRPSQRITIENVDLEVAQLRAAGDTFQQRGQVSYAGTVRDIADRISSYRSYASTRQQSYARWLLSVASTPTDAPRPPMDQPQTQTSTTASTGPATVAPTVEAIEQALRGVMAVPHAAVRNDLVRVSEAALQRIHALFNAAQSHGIQRPKINVRISDTLTLVLKLVMHGANAGWIYVKFGDRGMRYAGKISASGAFVPAFDCPQAVFEGLQLFGNDPLAIARAHGHATGNCCFCRRGLTDSRSVAMGYGPVCAENYGLEWGEQRAPSAVQADDVATDSTRVPANGVRMVNIRINAGVPERLDELANRANTTAEAMRRMQIAAARSGASINDLRRQASAAAPRPYLRARQQGRRFLEERGVAVGLNEETGQRERDLRAGSVRAAPVGTRGQGDTRPEGRPAAAPVDEDSIFMGGGDQE